MGIAQRASADPTYSSARARRGGIAPHGVSPTSYADHAHHGCLRVAAIRRRIDAVGLEKLAHGVGRHQHRLRRAASLGGPATTAGFSSAMPANLPSPSSAAAPEKPSAGAGDSARSLPPPTGVVEP